MTMPPWADRTIEAFERDRLVLERFLDVVPDVVIGIAEDDSIVFANARAERELGFPRDDLRIMRAESLIPERFREAHEANRNAFLADPLTYPDGTELRIALCRADGSEFPAEIMLTGFKVGGQTIAVASIRDISDRIEFGESKDPSQEELEQSHAQRLESLGRLASGIAHDFNNLLSVIISYADMAADETEDAEIKADIQQIQQSALRAASLTKQLLLFSRRDAIVPIPVAVNEVIQDVENLLRRTLGEQIELKTDLDPKLWTVLADPGQLEQVIVNLSINARDAMPDGGLLRIETANVEIDEEFVRDDEEEPGSGRYVKVTVSDSGHGMSPEVRDRAFEQFFTTKARAKGTGLGLATVYGIVKQANGSILIHSRPEHGTSIELYFPASDAQLDESEADRESIGGEGLGEVILVVEDDAGMRRLIERILTDNGYSVITHPEAGLALATIEDPESTIDLLLADVVLPGMQGPELAQRAHELRPDLKILLMSGHTEKIAARIDEPTGQMDLVEKPFTRNQLLSAVKCAIEKANKDV